MQSYGLLRGGRKDVDLIHLLKNGICSASCPPAAGSRFITGSADGFPIRPFRVRAACSGSVPKGLSHRDLQRENWKKEEAPIRGLRG